MLVDSRVVSRLHHGKNIATFAFWPPKPALILGLRTCRDTFLDVERPGKLM